LSSDFYLIQLRYNPGLDYIAY